MFSTLTKSDKVILAKENVSLPRTIVVNKFDEEAVASFTNEFQECLDSKQSIIPVYIDSYGGQVYSLLAMIDIIKSSPVPVATIAVGKAMSCGAVLLSCGTEGHRYVSSHSTVMIHEVASGTHGKIEEIKADVNEANRLNDKIFKMMANNCGKDDDYFKRIVHDKNHSDWYLEPQDCIYHGLANHVRVPKFDTKILVESTFA